jgi:hypothetical protein
MAIYDRIIQKAVPITEVSHNFGGEGHTNGPMAKPTTNKDVPNVATSSLIPNSMATTRSAELNTELAKVTTKVVKLNKTVAKTLLLTDQFSGLRGSSGPSNSTIYVASFLRIATIS